jgi:hypothetical protein
VLDMNEMIAEKVEYERRSAERADEKAKQR